MSSIFGAWIFRVHVIHYVVSFLHVASISVFLVLQNVILHVPCICSTPSRWLVHSLSMIDSLLPGALLYENWIFYCFIITVKQKFSSANRPWFQKIWKTEIKIIFFQNLYFTDQLTLFLSFGTRNKQLNNPALRTMKKVDQFLCLTRCTVLSILDS